MKTQARFTFFLSVCGGSSFSQVVASRYDGWDRDTGSGPDGGPQTIAAQLTDTSASLTQNAVENPPIEMPTDTPRPTNTPLVIATDTATPRPPTATPLVSNTPQPTISENFYEDDFEHGQGWATAKENNFLMEYSTGSYRINVEMNTGDAAVFSIRSPIYKDVRVEVDITKDLGPSDNYFGLMCRFQD
jgi:hypothetical protein